MLKVGIAGAGVMGSTHAAQYELMPDVQLIGIHDGKPEKAKRFIDKFGTQFYESYESMLDEADFVDICTPTPVHLELLLTAADRRMPIFVEKPLARTIEECDKAVEAVRRNGIKCQPGHVLRFFPEFAHAKQMVDSGAVGTPSAIRTRRGGAFPRTSSEWYNDFKQSGGVALDLIIHDFDWIRWTFGPVERVFCKSLTPRNLDGCDYALVTLRMKSGAVAHVEGTWADPGGFRVTFEIAGDKGLIDHDSKRSMPLQISKAALEGGAAGVAIPESPGLPTQNPYYLELRAFVDCLVNNTQPQVSIEDGREAVRIALAALESSETGKPVTLEGAV